MSAQGKEFLPECETVSILTPDELIKFKEEAYSTYSNGQQKHLAPNRWQIYSGIRPRR